MQPEKSPLMRPGETQDVEAGFKSLLQGGGGFVDGMPGASWKDKFLTYYETNVENSGCRDGATSALLTTTTLILGFAVSEVGGSERERWENDHCIVPEPYRQWLPDIYLSLMGVVVAGSMKLVAGCTFTLLARARLSGFDKQVQGYAADSQCLWKKLQRYRYEEPGIAGLMDDEPAFPLSALVSRYAEHHGMENFKQNVYLFAGILLFYLLAILLKLVAQSIIATCVMGVLFLYIIILFGPVALAIAWAVD